MFTNFEDFLRDKFMAQYNGIKDDAENAYDAWLSNLDVSDVIEYAEEAIAKVKAEMGNGGGGSTEPF